MNFKPTTASSPRKRNQDMPGKTHTPEQASRALAMRAAGWTVLAISQDTGISERSLQRIFSAAGTVKGEAKGELTDQAKKRLLSLVTSNEAIQEQAARFIADDLAHATHLRQLALEASRHLTAPTNLKEAAQVMRALAAHSTVLKNTSDMVRHSLQLEKRDSTLDELPELVITELTAEDVEQLRLQQGDQDDSGTLPTPPAPEPENHQVDDDDIVELI